MKRTLSFKQIRTWLSYRSSVHTTLSPLRNCSSTCSISMGRSLCCPLRFYPVPRQSGKPFFLLYNPFHVHDIARSPIYPLQGLFRPIRGVQNQTKYVKSVCLPSPYIYKDGGPRSLAPSISFTVSQGNHSFTASNGNLVDGRD